MCNHVKIWYIKWVYDKGQIRVVRMAKLPFWTLALRQNEERNCQLCLRLSVLLWGRETPQVGMLLLEWLESRNQNKVFFFLLYRLECFIATSTIKKNRISTREKWRLHLTISSWTLEQKFPISKQPCIILYVIFSVVFWPLYQLVSHQILMHPTVTQNHSFFRS